MKQKGRFCGALFLGLLISGVAFNVMGQGPVRTWVSGTTGVDGNPCTREQPCRTFNIAMAAVANRGEVVALDSAGYGPVSINKSVSLISPAGIHAAIAPVTGVAMTVDIAATDVVVIRGIYLNSQGALDGINHIGAGVLQVENCVVSGFGREGIEVDGEDTAFIELYVLDTLLRNNGGGFYTSIYVLDGDALIDNCRIENAGTGVFADSGARVVARNTAVAGADKAFWSRGGFTLPLSSSLTIDHCVAMTSNHGVFASGNISGSAEATVANSTIAANVVGIRTDPNGQVVVYGSILNKNANPLSAAIGTSIISFGNNAIYPAVADFTSTLQLK